MWRRYLVPLTLAVILAAVDQWTKTAVSAYIPLNRSLTVIDGFFNLVLVHNRGAAFGFLNRADIAWQVWLFSAFTLLATVIILLMIRQLRDPSWFSLSAFGAMLGGAAGNLIDRLRFRHVVDFLDFHLGGYHWPAFNVADIAICCGVFAFALLTLFPRHFR